MVFFVLTLLIGGLIVGIELKDSKKAGRSYDYSFPLGATAGLAIGALILNIAIGFGVHLMVVSTEQKVSERNIGLVGDTGAYAVISDETVRFFDEYTPGLYKIRDSSLKNVSISEGAKKPVIRETIEQKTRGIENMSNFWTFFDTHTVSDWYNTNKAELHVPTGTVGGQ